MILKQHLEIDGVEFDIAIRKPPPVDEAGGKELDRWMRTLDGVIKRLGELGCQFTPCPATLQYKCWACDVKEGQPCVADLDLSKPHAYQGPERFA